MPRFAIVINQLRFLNSRTQMKSKGNYDYTVNFHIRGKFEDMEIRAMYTICKNI